MTKIKIIGALIFILSVVLAILFNLTSNKHHAHNKFIDSINKQKFFTQDISKNIFYIYKNKSASTKKLDTSIDKFISNMNSKISYNDKKIILLWNKFYLDVQKFRDLYKVQSLYSNILLEKIVNNIYHTNLNLIIEFDKLTKISTEQFNKDMINYKYLQYSLFGSLVLLLIYLFTQIKIVITFIQKFLSTSKSIINNSTIKDLELIEVNNNSNDIIQASENFNLLVNKINSSIKHSSDSIEHSYLSLEVLDKNIEQLIEFVYDMSNEVLDKELNKKEDAVIQTLEELDSAKNKLINLKTQLNNLINTNK